MAKRISAGELRHTITVQSHGGATDSGGYGQTAASSTDWTTDATLRAKIEPLRGDELQRARQQYAQATHAVTCEYLAALASTGATRKRVLFGTREFHLGSVVNPEEEGWHLELLCREER